MLLVIDVGNTNITLGLYPPGKPVPGPAPKALWRLPSRRDATADELGLQLLSLINNMAPPPRVAAAAVASVVPSLDPVLREAVETYFDVAPLFIGPGVKTGVKNLYEPPGDVGADRLVDAAAAHARVKGACLVVDFGTATTFDCVSRDGSYLGGVITPGPRMAAEALARGTAKLPLLERLGRPPRAIGRSTQESLASGLFHGYVGLTEEILRKLKAEMGGAPAVLATGGLAGLWAPSVSMIREVVPHLTLEGLRLIWYRNQ